MHSKSLPFYVALGESLSGYKNPRKSAYSLALAYREVDPTAFSMITSQYALRSAILLSTYSEGCIKISN